MKKYLVAVVLIGGMAMASQAFASHSWDGYHWARIANPFTLKLGDNVSGAWDTHLVVASADWSLSSVLDTVVVGGSTNSRNCKPVTGTVQVCNSTYGNNGWLGIAQIWINGSHITKGTTKLNDTYFKTATYNTSAWRQLVICQEIGHTFGLDHQDETFGNPNLDTCMDYTNNPLSNQHPNQHDYDMLASIYAHLDTFNSYTSTIARGRVAASAQSGEFGNASEWGKAIGKDARGRDNEFERDLGAGNKIITHVFWVE